MLVAAVGAVDVAAAALLDSCERSQVALKRLLEADILDLRCPHLPLRSQGFGGAVCMPASYCHHVAQMIPAMSDLGLSGLMPSLEPKAAA